MERDRMAALLFVFLLIGSLAHASPVPGRWEKVESLRPGTRIYLSLASGEKLEATLQEVKIDGLTVLRLDGSEVDLPKSSVRKVVLPGRLEDDQVWNGLAIGAAAGAGTYIGLRQGFEAGFAPQDILGASFFAAIGMGIGALIDASMKRTEVVFQAR